MEEYKKYKINFVAVCVFGDRLKRKDKAIPVTGREGP
jgi:hypothetical protein